MSINIEVVRVPPEIKKGGHIGSHRCLLNTFYVLVAIINIRNEISINFSNKVNTTVRLRYCIED